MNTVSYDHPDPCIFTVLQCVTEDPGVSALDFVIFPPRWMVSENTFRPPYYHRNSMSEYMGFIQGVYDAKEQTVQLGESTLHSCMSAHGPEAFVFDIYSLGNFVFEAPVNSFELVVKLTR